MSHDQSWVMVDKDTMIEVLLAPLPNLQLAGPDRLLEPHTNEYLSESSIMATESIPQLGRAIRGGWGARIYLIR